MLQNTHVKLICFLVALILWVRVASNVPVQEVLALPLELSALSDSLVVRRAALPRTVDVRVRATKLQLLLAKFTRQGIGRVVVPLDDATPGSMRYDLDAGNVDTGATAVEIVTPASLSFRVHRLRTRRLPVRLALEGQPPPQHTIAGRPEISPSEVEVRGPEALVLALDHVNTARVDLSRRRSSFRERLRLASPDADLQLVPVEVEVSVGIDHLVERTFTDVPLAVLSDMDAARVHVDPTTAQVRVVGPRGLVDSMGPQDVSVLLHIGELEAGVYELPAEIVVPDGAGTRSVDPLVFRVIVEAEPVSEGP